MEPIKTAIEIAKELGLFEKVFNHSKLDNSIIKRYENKEISFDWVHLGNTNLKIGQLVDTIKSQPFLLPPRTGHIGNWNDIVLGRSGMIDYNKTICAEEKIGYPLIYSFNQTEDEDMVNGDWIYLPGSIVEDGVRIKLPLYTWNGYDGYEERSRNKSYFTPFVQTKINGRLTPLVRLHWENMSRHMEFKFNLEAEFILQNQDAFRRMLIELIVNSSQMENQQRALQDVISHSVKKDGSITRANLRVADKEYLLGDTYYRNIEELVEAALIPFNAVCNSEDFFGRMSEYPNEIPVVSNSVISIVSAMFYSHYPNYEGSIEQVSSPFNLHLHWGALGMAGYPPLKNGYFAEKSSIKTSRLVTQTIINTSPHLNPLFFVLMPASIYTICPTSEHTDDLEAINSLIVRILDTTAGLNETDLLFNKVRETVEGWLCEYKNNLSPYYMNRFAARRSVLNQVELPQKSRAMIPDHFYDLNFRQCSMIVGSLIESLNPK